MDQPTEPRSARAEVERAEADSASDAVAPATLSTESISGAQQAPTQGEDPRHSISSVTLVEEGTADDSDSTLGDDASSVTDSINSVNYQFRYQDGRRYHGFSDNVAYLLPNDEREQERLYGQHMTWLMALEGKLYTAPLKEDVGNVLDVATGTGIWAIEFADEHPNARVYGTDLSPIQPNFVPPNCSFVVEDSEQPWAWEHNFDFIHSRTLGSTWRDWPGYFVKCFKQLNPGGYLELHEFTFPFACDDNSAGSSNPMVQWSQYFVEAAAKGGVDMNAPAYLEESLSAAGFVDIKKTRLRLPFSDWGEGNATKNERSYGKFYGRIFDWGVSMALLTNRLGWPKEEAEKFLVEAKRDASNKEVHAYIPLYVYVCRKPEAATDG